MNSVERDPVMGPMLAFVRNKIQEHKQQHPGEMPDKALIRQWTQEASDLYDNIPDDLAKQRKYDCQVCEDSGLVGYEDHRGKHCQGACVSCSRGQRKHEQASKTGRRLGFAPIVQVDALGDNF